MARDTLTPKQSRFVEEYLIDRNATAAARRAGYSEQSASDIGRQLLQKTPVRSEIDRRTAELSRACGVRAERVLRELALLAFSNVAHYRIDEHGHVHVVDGQGKGRMRAVQSIRRKVRTIGEDTVEVDTEVRMWSKPAALTLLAKHLGLTKEREPLEVLLDALPPNIASILRGLIADAIRQGGGSAGGEPPGLPGPVEDPGGWVADDDPGRDAAGPLAGEGSPLDSEEDALSL